MKNIKSFESFNNPSPVKMSDLKTGDTIVYQGSNLDVIENDGYVIKVKSVRTNKQFYINQSQFDADRSIKLVSSQIMKEGKK